MALINNEKIYLKILFERMLKVVEGIRGHDNNSWSAAAELEFIVNEGIILAPNNHYDWLYSWAQPPSILGFPVLQETVRCNNDCVS
jgi:hypothetical protein